MNENTLTIQQALVLAIKHHTAGDLSKATRIYQRILRAAPNQPVALQLLGVIAHQEGNNDVAADLIGKALGLAPDYPEAHNNLGNVQRAQGRPDAAADSYRQAVALKPDYAEAHNNLGLALLAQLDFVGAIASYKTALGITPDYAQAHYNLGNAYKAQTKLDDAVASYKKAVTINPDHVPALNNLGNTLQMQGLMDDAIASYDQALAVDPENIGTHKNLSLAKKYSSSDTQIQQMLALHAKDSLSENERMQICFALGKAFEDTGEYEKSFTFLSAGNRLRKKELPYDLSVVREQFAKIRDQFDGDVTDDVENKSAADFGGRTPVFIVGMPRSGTTLVEQIISSHSEVHGGGELGVAEEAILQLNLLNRPLSREALDAFRSAYLTGISELGPDSSVITDKMPINFRWLGFILTAFPEAKIVHVKREAVATCWSIYKHDFSTSGNAYANDLLDISAYYKMYFQLMKFWHETFPGRICDVNYEQLTENQEAETRKIISAIGLDWQDSCMDFHENKRAVTTSSSLQVRQKIYKGSSSRWKSYTPFMGDLIESLKDYE